MKKPIKPKKPSSRELPPTVLITVSKLLVYDNKRKKFELIDHLSHPDIFSFSTNCVDDVGNEIFETNDELVPNWEKLEEFDYDQDNEHLSYNQYVSIKEDCKISADDFTVYPQYNSDRYYSCSIVRYKCLDPEYDKKLEIYNNRFKTYELALAKYEDKLKKYEEFRRIEKKKKLQEQLNKL